MKNLIFSVFLTLILNTYYQEGWTKKCIYY